MATNLEEIIHDLIRISGQYQESRNALINVLSSKYLLDSHQIGLVFKAITYSQRATDINDAAKSIASLIIDGRVREPDVMGLCACIQLQQE